LFFLGTQSEKNLEGVAPALVMCVRRAISLSSVDFAVFEGVRTEARQRELVASGASRTMHSYHLTGRAVDLVPYLGKHLQWQLPLCEQVAISMREAAAHFGVTLTWGAVWDRRLGALNPVHIHDEIGEYTERYRAARANTLAHPLIDGPHFQLEAA
jgi:peptidoglycan L-alanyl-D-glutamate endopeptidase CwlK